ncbi:MAG TPA: hypothetical protein VFA26_18550 [Gemmataceae bacterium]|nr:hypothetical protein [Gemmataceae bacterium]
MRVKYTCLHCGGRVARKTRRGIWSSCPVCGRLNLTPGLSRAARRRRPAQIVTEVSAEQLALFGTVGYALTEQVGGVAGVQRR